jgi:hypothetical protein
MHRTDVRDVEIRISNEAMCLGVLLDSKLTFGPHIWRLFGKCFYHWRQIKRVCKSLTADASKTTVHAFITSRVDYRNSVMLGTGMVHVRPLQNVLNVAVRLVLFNSITSLPISKIICTGYLFNSGKNTRCSFVYKCLHELAPAYLAEMWPGGTTLHNDTIWPSKLCRIWSGVMELSVNNCS